MRLLLILVLLMPLKVFPQFILNGEAMSLGGDCYQLTPNNPWKVGSIWYDSLINLEDNFDVNFDIFLGSLDVNGADGIAFVLQPVSTGLGSGGGGLGYEDIEPSVNIEFDTWQNADNDDPSYDHVAIMQDGVLSHTAATALSDYEQIIEGATNAEDGLYHQVRITWDATLQTLSCFVDCDFRVSYTGDIIDAVFDGDPFVYMGFTAATGGSTNIQSVCMDYVSAIDLMDDNTICQGDTTELSVPDGYAAYNWSPAISISSTDEPSVQVWPEITTTYIVTLTDECGFEIFDTVVISIIEPVFSLLSEPAVCSGTVITASGGFTEFEWSTGETTSSISITEPGIYWVNVGGGGACPESDTVEITEVFDTPTIDLAEQAGFCEGLSLVLDAGSGYEDYFWSTGELTSSIIVETSGEFSCTIFDVNGCSAADTVTIEEFSPPQVEFGWPNLYLCGGQTEWLNVYEVGATYLWHDGSTGFTFLADTAGVYSVTVTSSEGCSDSDEVTVVSDCLEDLYFPNVFSPNGDGLNDVFRPVLFSEIDNYQLFIWNRWGNQIFMSTQYEIGWDGYFEGIEQELGTYIYNALYTSDEGEFQISGTVLMMR